MSDGRAQYSPRRGPWGRDTPLSEGGDGLARTPIAFPDWGMGLRVGRAFLWMGMEGGRHGVKSGSR